MSGISGEVIEVAAHPTDPATVALATKTGLFLSKDSGSHFEKVLVTFPVTSVSFDMTGELMIGGSKAIMIKNTTGSRLMEKSWTVEFRLPKSK